MSECQYILPLPHGMKSMAALKVCGDPAQWMRTFNGLSRYYCERHQQLIAHVTPNATWEALPNRFEEMRRSLKDAA